MSSLRGAADDLETPPSSSPCVMDGPVASMAWPSCRAGASTRAEGAVVGRHGHVLDRRRLRHLGRPDLTLSSASSGNRFATMVVAT